MKKLLLIGGFDRTTENLYHILVQEFGVQLCPESTECIAGILRIVKPGLVVVNAAGRKEGMAGIVDMLSGAAPSLPVLLIGEEEENSGYPCPVMSYPVNPLAFLERCRSLLPVRPQQEERESSPDRTGRKRILLVDDSAIFLRTTKAMLDDQYDVMVALSGEAAIKTIRKKQPDLILLDYEMPDCDGKMTLEMIREDEEIADIPVVFVTSVSDKQQIAGVLHLNPAGYLLKPLEKEKVRSLIEEVLSP